MPRETNAAKRERAVEVCERLNRRYGPVSYTHLMDWLESVSKHRRAR